MLQIVKRNCRGLLFLFFVVGIFFAGLITFACVEVIGRDILKVIEEEEGPARFYKISKSVLPVWENLAVLVLLTI